MGRIWEEQAEKTILVKGHVQNILKDYNLKRKARGINMTFYTPDGLKPDDNDAQTVINFCSNMINPNPVDQKGEEDIDRLIGSALDKILISDRVRSQKDFNGGNGIKSSSTNNNQMIIETNLTKLEDTELDSYIKRATDISRLKNGDKFGRIYCS